MKEIIESGTFDMGSDPPITFRRVITNEGKYALAIDAGGQVNVHGSSMNTVYITTCPDYLVGHLSLPGSPGVHSRDIVKSPSRSEPG